MVADKKVDDTLARHQRNSALFVSAMFGLTIILLVLALLEAYPRIEKMGPLVPGSLWLLVLFLGLGAVALKRTRLSPVRLAALMGVGGMKALAASLQRTVIYIALLAGLIAVIGYAAVCQTGDNSHMVKAGIISVAILLYCYPGLGRWNQIVRYVSEQNPNPGSQ
jgi:hypothetical protein